MAFKRLNLIRARIEAGLSQEALAEKLDAHRATISNWENGLTEPYPYFKGLLKELFGADISILLRVFEVPDDSPEDGATCTPPSWTLPTPTLQSFVVSHPIRQFWLIAHTDYSTPGEMIADIQAVIKDMTMTTGDPITRRDALLELTSIPLIGLGKNATLKPSKHEEVLRYCTVALEGCWTLYRGIDPQGVQHAFECCSAYVPLLETIACDSSQFRKQALDLAARYATLKTMLGWQCVGAREVISCAQNALYLGKQSENILIQLSTRTKLNWTYLLNKQPIRALETMQEGEHTLKAYQKNRKGPELPTGVIGNFYSSYSMIQVENGIDSDVALGIATECTPLDDHVAFMEFSTFDQQREAAWICTSKGNPMQAIKHLEKLIDPETFVPRPGVLATEWGDAINILTRALLQFQDRDMNHIIRAWQAGMEAAQTFKHEERYQEAITNFTVMRSLWPGEQAMRSLLPLTSHW